MLNKLQVWDIEEDESVQQIDKFKITDKSGAEWALRKIAAHQTAMTENEELATKEHERIDTWLTNENQKHINGISYLKSMLNEFMLTEVAKDEKCRSIKLPHGTLRMRKMPLKWEFDDVKTIAYLENNYPDMVQLIKKFDKAKVKEIVKKTGEIWDGLQIIEQEDKFEVEV